MAELLPFQSLRPAGEMTASPDLQPTAMEPLSGFCSPSVRQPLPGLAGGPDLTLDETPGLYAYRHDFRSETGVEKNRIGVIGLLRPDEGPASQTFTIQETEPHGVAHRAKEMETLGRQEHPVVGAIEDPSFQLESLIQASLCRGAADIDIQLPGNERHRVWRIGDPRNVVEIQEFLRGKDCFLLDGLHAYRALRHMCHGDREFHPLAVLYNFMDLGVGFASACLLVGALRDFNVNELVLRMDHAFDAKVYPFGRDPALPRALADFREDLRIRGYTDGVLGACFAGVDQFFIFQLREGVDRDSLFLPDVPPPLRELDQVLLRHVVLDRYLGAPGPGSSTGASWEYCWSVEEAIAAVRSGQFTAAFLLNPPAKRKILQFARSRLRLPAGSLRIDPPSRSGLVACAIR